MMYAESASFPERFWLSHIAQTAARTGDDGCIGVNATPPSSKSNACAKVPFTQAASRAVVLPLPFHKTVSPCLWPAMTAARFSAKGSKVAPIATPKVSITCRFACLKTSAGISSDVVRVTKSTIASVVPIDDSPQFSVRSTRTRGTSWARQRTEQLFFCNIGLIEYADQAKNDREEMGNKQSFGSLLVSKDLGC